MTKEELNHSDPIKKWIHEAGTHELGEDFHLSVLKKIETRSKTSSAYEPVISPLAWKLILIFIIGIFSGSWLFLPSSQNDMSLYDKLPSIKFPNSSFLLYDFNLPLNDFSPQFIMGIITFFILGFITVVSNLRNKQAGV